mgnify:CR=1 FL=1
MRVNRRAGRVDARAAHLTPDTTGLTDASVFEAPIRCRLRVVTPHRSSMSSNWAELRGGSFAASSHLASGEMDVAVLEAGDHEEAFAVDARRVRGHWVCPSQSRPPGSDRHASGRRHG